MSTINSLQILKVWSLVAFPPKYMVLYRHQNDGAAGISIAEFNGIGWQNCSEPGQPNIIQYFSPITGRFENGKPE